MFYSQQQQLFRFDMHIAFYSECRLCRSKKRLVDPHPRITFVRTDSHANEVVRPRFLFVLVEKGPRSGKQPSSGDA